MEQYLKLFKNQADYEAASEKPPVSHIIEEVEVIQNIDPYGGHDYVEIGGLKWATMNIGANSITDKGLFFQWGDTQGYTAAQVGSGSGQKYFGWADYKYGNGGSSESDMTKYNSTDSKTVLDASDDAAQAAWGGNWRMPTKEDFAALSAAVTTVWVTNYQGSGVNGRLMTDKNDSSKVLFFPAAGYCENGNVRNVGSTGRCWSSSLDTDDVLSARSLYFYGVGVYWQDYSSRYYGFPVRGILDV